jgi:hypothetical protein
MVSCIASVLQRGKTPQERIIGMTSETTPPPPTRQVYHLGLTGPLLRLSLILGGLIAVWLIFRLVDFTFALFSALSFAVVVGVVGLVLYFAVSLTLSPEGITYRNMWFSIITPWANVTSLGHLWYNGKTYDCLLLGRNHTRSKGWQRALFKLHPKVNALHVVSGRGKWIGMVDEDAYVSVIPVGHFKDWHTGPLAEAVRRRAPQVFIEE